jgi:FAD/FMN-containing dehydrogenase
MTRTMDPHVSALQGEMSGPVLVPGDAGYDEARSVWNGDIDRYPAVIARCAGPDDVAAALRYAQQVGLEVAVRGGGHGYWGAAVPEGGLMVDLSPIHHVLVDPAARRARVGGGATLGQLDAATQEHGLAVPAGTVSHTGVGGLTLGGGWGWLSRLHGLTIDNLESAQVVLADGRCLRASLTEHPDLFWALRGGGGNFGVVTEFEFRLHELGPIVQLAMLFVEQDRAAYALRTARDFIDSDSLARTTSAGVACSSAPPAPFVPAEHHFARVAAVIIIGFGTPEEHVADVAAVRAALQPAFEMTTPLPYAALQQMLDEGVPWGIRSYTKGLYLDELTDATIETLAGHLPQRRSPQSQVLMLPLVGAFGDVRDDATAFGGSRSLRYVFAIEGISMDEETFAHDRRWVRDTWDALRPAAVHDGAYVNLMAEFEGDSLRATYGAAKFDRLRRIKGVYDPENVFRHNANIPPA